MHSPTIALDVSEPLVGWLEDAARRAIAERGTFSLALPGGSVATTCFPRLARAEVAWGRTHFFWGDERAVPPADPESNFGVARRLWLDPIAGDAPHVHRMDADRPDLERAAAEHELLLRAVAKGGLDVAILGVGPDGHVCSLFPGHPLLDERDAWVAVVTDSPKPPPRRMTLTLPALLAARLVVVVALGAAKADVVRAAIEEESCQLPLALVLRGASDARLLLDPAAAARLRAP